MSVDSWVLDGFDFQSAPEGEEYGLEPVCRRCGERVPVMTDDSLRRVVQIAEDHRDWCPNAYDPVDVDPGGGA